MQLLTALLQCNPFTASMTVDDLRWGKHESSQYEKNSIFADHRQQLEKEMETLKKLMPDEEEEAAIAK